MRIKSRLAVVLGLALCGVPGGAAIAEGIGQKDADLIGQIHFVGIAQISADPNATNLNEIGKLPESGVLREEIVQKLATTPFRVMNKNSPERKDDHAALLSPVVEDILQSESYVEMRATTNAWPEVVLAVRLDNQHAENWRTSLAKTLTDWTGIAVSDIQADGFKGWELKKHHAPNLFRFFRAGDWVVFGWGQDELLRQPGMLQKIKDTQRPIAAAKNYWLDGWIDWSSLTAGQPSSLPFKVAKLKLNIQGRKDFLRPQLTMQFAEPLGLKIEPWRIPTNTIFDPVDSLTLMRGFGALAGKIPVIAGLKAEPLPNQVILWAMQKMPLETSIAFPVKDGSNYLDRIAPALVSELNSSGPLKNNRGSILWTTNHEITMRGMPFAAPFFRATKETTGEYLVGGIFGEPPHLKPFAWELIHSTISPDNVVYYDWELNAERTTQWRPLTQLYFINQGRMLPRVDAPGQKWVAAIKPKLKTCGTVGTLTAPNELNFVRNAQVGLTGFELNMMALWVDAPGFPLEMNVEAPISPDGVAPGPPGK